MAAVLVVYVMREPVHPVGVRVQAGVDHRAAGTARRYGRECVREQRAASSEPIEIRSAQHWIAIDAEIESLIVRNDQHYVARVSHRDR